MCVCVETQTETQREPLPVLLSRQWDLAENWGANIICGLQQSMLKYKHGWGCYALNASLFCQTQTQRQKRKNNTSYNRLQKIISILSVCLTIEAILCVYGRRGKTDWLSGRHTGSWLQNQANPQLFSTKKERKSVQFLTNKCTILFILVHQLSHPNPLSHCIVFPIMPTFEHAVPWLNNTVDSFHTSSGSWAYNYRSLAHNSPVNEC